MPQLQSPVRQNLANSSYLEGYTVSSRFCKRDRLSPNSIVIYSCGMTIPLDDHELSPEQLINERVHQLMFRAKISQSGLAKHLGMSQAAVSRKIRGDRSWSFSELVEVSRVLGVRFDDIVRPLLENEKSRPLNGDGTSDASRLRESNPRPIHYEVSGATVVWLEDWRGRSDVLHTEVFRYPKWRTTHA